MRDQASRARLGLVLDHRTVVVFMRLAHSSRLAVRAGLSLPSTQVAHLIEMNHLDAGSPAAGSRRLAADAGRAKVWLDVLTVPTLHRFWHAGQGTAGWCCGSRLKPAANAVRSRLVLRPDIARSRCWPPSVRCPVDMYLASLPAIGRLLDAPTSQVQLTILGLHLIGFAVGQVFYGPLSDRHGRRPVLLAAAFGIYLVRRAARLHDVVFHRDADHGALYAGGLGYGSGVSVLARATAARHVRRLAYLAKRIARGWRRSWRWRRWMRR